MSSPVPDNIVFHDSYKDKIEEKYNNTNQAGTEDNKFTFFWLTDSPFSQWHPSIFEVKGVRFTSAEQFMMFCKAKLFKDEEIAQQILALNEEVEHLTSSTGEIIDSRYTILAKFNHGQITKEKILETPSLKKEWGAYQKKIKDLGRQVKNYDEKILLNVINFKAYMFKQNFDFFKYAFKHLSQKEIEETIIHYFLGGAVLNSDSHKIELLHDFIKQNNISLLEYFFTHIICFFIRYECSLNVNIDINRLDLFFNFLDKLNFKLSEYKKIHSVILKNICNSYFIDNNTRAIESTLSLINYFINKGLSVNSHNYEFDKRPAIHLFLDYRTKSQETRLIGVVVGGHWRQ